MARYKKCNWGTTRPQRRKAAEARKEVYMQRTPTEQIALIAERRGNSAKEKAKMDDLMSNHAFDTFGSLCKKGK